MELRNKILFAATELFFRYGIKRITMDDISREMGISKKTLYQSFKEKDEIIASMCEVMMKQNIKEMELLTKAAKDPVHEAIETGKHISKVFSKINPVFFYELKRFCPAAWSQFETFKQTHIMRILVNNLKKGIELKIYRSDLNIDLVARYRLAQVDMGLDPTIFKTEKNLAEIQVFLLDHFLHGITTIKGHKLINKYKELQDEE
jgi:TetR/AcrR family transcriptional regulator, cholesterol catabolism regulator